MGNDGTWGAAWGSIHQGNDIRVNNMKELQGPPSVTEKLKVGEAGADGVSESGQVTDGRRPCWQLHGLRFLLCVKQEAIEGSEWRRDVI